MIDSKDIGKCGRRIELKLLNLLIWPDYADSYFNIDAYVV